MRAPINYDEEPLRERSHRVDMTAKRCEEPLGERALIGRDDTIILTGAPQDIDRRAHKLI